MKSLLQMAYLTMGLTLFALACNTTDPVQELIIKTEQLHDVETMPRMSKLVKFQKQLRTEQFNYIVEGDTLNDFYKIDTLFNALTDAEDAMMRWMPQYHDEKEALVGKTKEEQLNSMEEQLNGIEIVKELMDKSMEEAALFLKKDK